MSPTDRNNRAVNMASYHAQAPAQDLGGMDSTMMGFAAQFSNLPMPSAAPNTQLGYYGPHDGAVLVPPMGSSLHAIGLPDPAGAQYAPYPAHNPYVAQHNVAAAYVPYGMVPYTPGRGHAYLDRPERTSSGSREVPGLENRRGSYSTTESTPATPFFGSTSDTGRAGGRVTVVDRSNYTTPSPQQIAISGMMGQSAGKETKAAPAADPQLELLLSQDPAVPRAIPALFTPRENMKTLEQCLENRIPGNKNVYIRGLHPTTDDDLLLKYASRFGPVDQSKAIIDTATGACKGFGFAKFKDVAHSERCIRGFYHLGYEVGFARESFNARLKAEGDESSTNLYISNLPKNVTEHELGAIFQGYTILSSKILRDGLGNSRGVGFARFQSREICEDIIAKFHNVPLGEAGLHMQVRYADTPAQKELKRVTAERRQFRTNEYNIGAYGTAAVGNSVGLYPGWNRRYPSGASSVINSSSVGLNSSINSNAATYNATQTPEYIPVAASVAQTGEQMRTKSTASARGASDDSCSGDDDGATVAHSPAKGAPTTSHSSPIKAKTEDD